MPHDPPPDALHRLQEPYAYLAKDPAYAFADALGVGLDWLSYTLHIPDFLGSARVAPDGTVLESERSPHQWRRVKYSYIPLFPYCHGRLTARRLLDTLSLENTGDHLKKRRIDLRLFQEHVAERPGCTC